MPQGGETFARALDSLEARCRSETRILYESEGKAELLGEDGVPDSLRTWLEESRGRALDEGGHREGAQRRLREQVGIKGDGVSARGDKCGRARSRRLGWAYNITTPDAYISRSTTPCARFICEYCTFPPCYLVMNLYSCTSLLCAPFLL